MNTALILPCAGRGGRLNLPYPKEIHVVDGEMLIDRSLILAAAAGITEAFIVTTEEKRKPLAKALGVARFGVRLKYVVSRPDDSQSLPGSVLRGCRSASFYEYDRFVVALPDTRVEDESAMQTLLSVPSPAFGLFAEPPTAFDAVYARKGKVQAVRVKKPLNPHIGDFVGTWGLLSLDNPTVKLLKRHLDSTPAAQDGDHHLLGELIDLTIPKLDWSYVNIPSKYWDLGTWDAINAYAKRNEG